MAQVVVERPQYFDESKHRIAMVDALSGNVFQLLEHRIGDVKFKKSKEEKDNRRKLYRKIYTKRPHVMEKLKKRMMDPLTIRKKKEYAAREDVKERKKVLSKRKSIIPAKLKALAPAIYHEIMSEVTRDMNAPKLFDCYGSSNSSSDCF